MEKDTALKHFGSQVKIANALGISEQAVSKWKHIVPWSSALELQHITNGVIQRDNSLYKNKRPIK